MVERWRRESDSVLWIDVEGDDCEGSEALLAGFGLHALAVQDALRPRHPPKLEVFDDFVFVLLRGLDARTTGLEFGVIQLAM